MELGETLLRIAQPVSEGLLTKKKEKDDRLAKQKIAETQANSKITYGQEANSAKRFAALMHAQAAIQGKRIDAENRLKLNSDDNEAAMIKAASSMVSPWMNIILQGQNPRPEYTAMVKYLMDRVDMDPTQRSLLYESYGANSVDSGSAFDPEKAMESLVSDPMLRSDPKASADVAEALRTFKAMKMKPASGVGTAPPQVAPTAPPTQTPTPSASTPQQAPTPPAYGGSPAPAAGGSPKGGLNFNSREEANQYYQSNDLPSGTKLVYPGGTLRVP